MFVQIESNKRWSAVLMLACIGLFVAFGWALDTYFDFPYHLGLIAALVVAVGTAFLGYYEGDDLILAASAAREITHDDNPRLFNVVEELSVACGLPMPRVFLIDSLSPNAFATGRDPKSAAIAITRGLMEKLDRDELQAVLAHELAHVRNYDTRFMMLITVMVGTIALISDLIWRGRCYGRLRGKAALPLLALALVLLILAPIAAKLIQLAASRRREYLADASAALMTRYPAALASALRKLEADPLPLHCANRATQHLYIVNPLKNRGGSSLWDTHPPLSERILRLEKMAYIGTEEAAPGTPLSGLPAAALPVGALPVVAAAGASLVGARGGSEPEPEPEPVTETNACPRCFEPLKPGRIGGRRIAGCKACGGIWLGEDELQELLIKAPQQLVAADDRFPNLLGEGWQSLGDKKRCPACGQALRPTPLPGHRGLIVDRCEQGHGTWFDDTELASAAGAHTANGGGGPGH